jgi:hypothetical protein
VARQKELSAIIPWEWNENSPNIHDTVGELVLHKKFLLLLQGGDRFSKRSARKSEVVARVLPSRPPLHRSLNASRRCPLLTKGGEFKKTIEFVSSIIHFREAKPNQSK